MPDGGAAADSGSAGGLLDGLGFSDGSLIADRQLPAALGTAPRQYSLTILGFHARPEAMRLGTFAIIRLERSLRHCVSSGSPGRQAAPRRWVDTSGPGSKYQYSYPALLKSIRLASVLQAKCVRRAASGALGGWWRKPTAPARCHIRRREPSASTRLARAKHIQSG